MSDKIYLFTDGSVHPQSGMGFGAFLLIEDHATSAEEAKNLVQVKKFENTSSTKLELQILLHALVKFEKRKEHVIVCTDSQNIVGLLGRRDCLEKNDYRSKSGKLISNCELYQEFYKITDLLNCQIVKVKGHQKSSHKNKMDSFFTLVDRAARNALREVNFS
ncbi:ribonuclease HI [Labilibaculum sp.]|uniref:ribonuclease HI n=1 Tax=Labilibaculum sp. TaxID=2060723 RepID=UPI003568D913